MKHLLRTASSFLVNHQTKIILFLGIGLFGMSAFLLGTIHGREWQQDPLVMEKPTHPEWVEEQGSNPEGNAPSDEHTITPTERAGETTPFTEETCVYIGSMKGTKYYPPTCAAAENIAPENLRCFASEGDAAAQGYTRSSACGS